MSTLQYRFGAKLKLLRVARGLTQEEFAERAELTSVFISQVERGLNQPSFRNIERFAEILKVQEMELFNFNGFSQIDIDKTIGIRAPRKPTGLIVRHKSGLRKKPNSAK